MHPIPSLSDRGAIVMDSANDIGLMFYVPAVCLLFYSFDESFHLIPSPSFQFFFILFPYGRNPRRDSDSKGINELSIDARECGQKILTAIR